jgi:hypothetical protein
MDRIADPHHFKPDRDPAFHFNADLDQVPAVHLYADTFPTPAPHKSRVSDPYSFFRDPDPAFEAGDQCGSGSNPDPGL